MLIPVTLSPSSSSSNPKLPSGLVKISHDEIVLIELQGSLEVELTHPRERDGKFVGKLKIDDATNKPTLLIGHHLLEGKVAPLPKPYAILVRKGNGCDSTAAELDAEYSVPKQMSTSMSSGNDSDGDTEAMAVDAAQGPDSGGSGSDQGSSLGWTISGIVKKKIIFSKRPMPVVGKKLMDSMK